MFYPEHHLWDYCTYLGSEVIEGVNIDLGVFEIPNTDGAIEDVSHAIVYGKQDWEYLSGPIESGVSMAVHINRAYYQAYQLGIPTRQLR